MKKIIIFSSILLIASVVSLISYFRFSSVSIPAVRLEVDAPLGFQSQFHNFSETWNTIYDNVSTIPQFWNAVIPSNLEGKSILQAAALYNAIISSNNPDYAYCYAIVPKTRVEAFNQTFTRMGFIVDFVANLIPE